MSANANFAIRFPLSLCVLGSIHGWLRCTTKEISWTSGIACQK